MQSPSWFSLDLFLKIFMPLLTFVLGVAATLWMKNVEKRRDFIREQVRAVWSLANDWYNQLIDLRAKGLDPSITDEEMQRAVFVYVHNRIILPKLLLSLELLRRSGKSPEMVGLCEEFLQLVTTCESQPTGSFVSDRMLPFFSPGDREDDPAQHLECRMDPWALSKITGSPDPTLEKLDQIVQRMTLTSSAFLSEKGTRVRKATQPTVSKA